MRGKWIRGCHNGVATYTCSCCNGFALENSFFCPNCGADLRCILWKQCKSRACWNARCYEGLDRYSLDDLKDIIKEKFDTVRKFSEQVGLTESALSFILSGKKPLLPWNADNFAKVLEIDRHLLDGVVSE